MKNTRIYEFHKSKWSTTEGDQEIVEWGSISKIITSFLVYKLSREKNIDITKAQLKISQSKNISLKSLIQNTSGIPRIPDDINSYSDYTNAQLFEYLERVSRGIKPKYLYSNTGYALLASWIDSNSETGFNNYLEESLEEDFGISETYVLNKKRYSDLFKIYGEVVEGYWFKDNYFNGAGSLCGPIKDLKKFVEILLGKEMSIISNWISLLESDYSFRENNILRVGTLAYEEYNDFVVKTLDGETDKCKTTICSIDNEKTLLIVGPPRKNHYDILGKFLGKYKPNLGSI